MATGKIEALATAREVDLPGLLRMELESEAREHGAHPLAGFLDLRLRVTEHHEVVGIADQRAEMRTPVFPHPVEDMQVDV